MGLRPSTSLQTANEAASGVAPGATPPSSGLLNSANTISQRPQRKAKTKEAVLKHLNRDVELLEEKKAERKSVGKRQAGVATGNPTLQNQSSASGSTYFSTF